MGELLLFEDTALCYPADDMHGQRQLFNAHVAMPGDVAIIMEDAPTEWTVLLGNALLVVSKATAARVFFAKTDAA